MQAIQNEERRKQAGATALKAAQDEERRAKVARMKEITVVLLDLNGNPGQTFQLKRDLQKEQPQALRGYICGLDSLPYSWNRKYLRESDLVLSIGDAAISGEMSLHQNGQCRLPDGCDPLSLSACVFSGVTDGTVISVTVMNAAADRWQQIAGSR